ncbi:hypothetical protein Leryth_011474 [Lithospermum erythrorhizon]|nr:hypothetical protein Leryth_011474 [Lithospermum erythrorhizon]
MAMQRSSGEEILERIFHEVELCFTNYNLMLHDDLRNIITQQSDGMISLAWLLCSVPHVGVHLGLKDAKPADIPQDILMAVAETLRKSPELKISEDGKKVGRIDPVPDSCYALVPDDARTLVVFPIHDADDSDLLTFFNQHAKIEYVRKHIRETFAFVQFSTEEEALKVLKRGMPKFNGADLELKQKKEFDTERKIEQEEVKKTKSDCGSYAEDSKGDICKAEEVEGSTKEAKVTNTSVNDQKRSTDGDANTNPSKARRL